MKMQIVVAASVSVFGFAAAAHAAQLSSPAIFGAHTQDIAHCVVVNGGTTTVAVILTILDESGGILARRGDAIDPGGFASVDSFIPFGVAHACIVTTASSVANLRAALTIVELVPGGTRPIRSAPLR